MFPEIHIINSDEIKHLQCNKFQAPQGSQFPLFSLSLPTPTSQRSPFRDDPPLAGLAGGTWPCRAPGDFSPSGAQKAAPSSCLQSLPLSMMLLEARWNFCHKVFGLVSWVYFLFPSCKHQTAPADCCPCFSGSSTLIHFPNSTTLPSPSLLCPGFSLMHHSSQFSASF